MKHLSDYQVNDRIAEREWSPTYAQLRQYAEASGDLNPIHLDDAYARRAGLDGVIAHGMLTMAQAGAMLMEWMGGEGTLKSFAVRFERMVSVGERIKFSGYVKDKDSDGLACVLVATNDKGEKKLSGSAVLCFESDR